MYNILFTNSAVHFFFIQKGNDKYKVAANTEGGGKKDNKDQNRDDLKKELDLVFYHQHTLHDLHGFVCVFFFFGHWFDI